MTVCVSDQELVKNLCLGDIKSAEALVSRYEVKVYSMAMHLTSNEAESGKITERVFAEVVKNVLDGSEEEFEKMIHRVTYEFAIASLLGRVEQHNKDVRQICSELSGLDMIENYYEDTEDPIQFARWCLMDAGDTLDATNQMLDIIESE